MKNAIKCFLCAVLALVLATMTACSLFWSSNPTYSGGQMLDDELMSQMKSDVLGEKTETSNLIQNEETSAGETELGSPDTEESSSCISGELDSTATETDGTTQREEQNALVYWTKGGGVYHIYRDCGYLKSSSEILSGTVEEALGAGKSGVCSRCQKRNDNE